MRAENPGLPNLNSKFCQRRCSERYVEEGEDEKEESKEVKEDSDEVSRQCTPLSHPPLRLPPIF